MYKVKVISLKRRKDRREKMLHLLQKVPFEFIDALDGKDYKLTAADKEFIKHNEYSRFDIHIPSLVCANYMHLNLLDECANQDLPYIILEDDIELTDETPPEKYFETLSSVNDLDAFFFIGKTPSIAAYMVWPKGAKKMLKYIEKVKLNRGLDWQFWTLREIDKTFRCETPKIEYFRTIPGHDSDITNTKNYDISSNK